MRLPAEFDGPPRIAGRCWAFGPQGRCESFGGHEDDHQIVITWDDEACVNPATFVPVIALPAYDPPLGGPAAVAGCFTCGCLEEAHLEVGEDGEAMCKAHQCRSYIP